MAMTTKYGGTVKWSEIDQCYVGTCPRLFFGGCHGDDMHAVARELDEIIKDCEESVTVSEPKERRILQAYSSRSD